jgi:hypothetical protein
MELSGRLRVGLPLPTLVGRKWTFEMWVGETLTFSSEKSKHLLSNTYVL